MKKSLLALAVMSSLANMAAAQTSVIIYGVADAGIAFSDNGAANNSKAWKMGSGQQSGSRLGFKGTEDLGGGLKAIFTLENGFNIDDGTSGQGGRLFGRQAFVGLQGGFGSVKLGRQNIPLRGTLEAIDPFAIGLAGNIMNIFQKYDERSDNTLNYTTPNMSGFSGQAAYSFGEVAGSTSTGRQLGLSGAYANGPIYLGLAYHDLNKTGAAIAPATGVVDAGSGKTVLLGGTYNFNVIKAHAGYAWNKGDATNGASNLDSRDLMLGLSAPIGAGTILASYIRHSDKQFANADANQWALGYTYAMSKRTNLYTSYGRVSNDANAAFGGSVKGGNASLFNVGIRHKF